jgi:nucleotide-binding universal stress UspA family protein
MNDTLDAVVVGVDGSPAARAAVSWAVAEARDRGVPLRLVTVIADDRASGDRARDALRLARAAVEDQSPMVAFEEVIRHGEVARELLVESRSAALICVGARHRMGAPLGVIAATLAERAQCAVAVICADDVDHDGVIAVVLDDEPDNDAVVLQAMKEGRLRHATVRQIDRRLTSWVRRFPDVHVETVAAGTGLGFGEPHRRGLPQLAVLGRKDAMRVASVVTPNCHPIIGYPDCSLLFVHDV